MQNHFTLLELPEDFALDISALEKRYFEKQREFHPDRQAGKGSAEKQRALLDSMAVNQAYQALKNPLLRAQHLLALHDIQVNTDGKDTLKPSPELLMEMMELREELSDCQSLPQLEKLEHYGAQEWDMMLAALAEHFATQHWESAGLAALRLRYLEKFREELRVIRSQRFPQSA